jgi:hypothetical protein
MTARPGRPPRSTSAAAERLEIRLTTAELAAWRKAAGDKTLSDWARETLNRKASR